MSAYGSPPDPNQPNPYGDQPAHGQPAAQGNYAHWGKRVGAYLIDGILQNVVALPLWIGYFMMIGDAVDTANTTTFNPDGTLNTTVGSGGPSGAALALIVIGALLSLAFFVWNSCIKQGKTGYSIGKGVLGIKLIGIQTGQPIGAGMSFVRQLAHIVDSLPCYIGFLWPLWDEKKQTFADKILSTVVIEQPKG